MTPYWFRCVTGRGLFFGLLKKSFAVRVFGWLNSQSEPCRLLVPVLMTWLSVPPAVWPKAASDRRP